MKTSPYYVLSSCDKASSHESNCDQHELLPDNVFSMQIESVVQDALKHNSRVCILVDSEPLRAIVIRTILKEQKLLFGVTASTIKETIRALWDEWGSGKQHITPSVRYSAISDILNSAYGDSSTDASLPPLHDNRIQDLTAISAIHPSLTSGTITLLCSIMERASYYLSQQNQPNDDFSRWIVTLSKIYLSYISQLNYIEETELIHALDGRDLENCAFPYYINATLTSSQLLTRFQKDAYGWIAKHAHVDNISPSSSGIEKDSYLRASFNINEELDKLRAVLFNEDDSILKGTSAVSLLQAAGPHATNSLITSALDEAYRDVNFSRALIACNNSQKTFHDLAPALAARGFEVHARLSWKMHTISSINSLLTFAECVLHLMDLKKTWPESSADSEGNTYIALGDMRWWPPLKLCDFLTSDIAQMSISNVYTLNARWRENRLLTPDQVLRDLSNPHYVSPRVSCFVSYIKDGKLDSALQELYAESKQGPMETCARPATTSAQTNTNDKDETCNSDDCSEELYLSYQDKDALTQYVSRLGLKKLCTLSAELCAYQKRALSLSDLSTAKADNIADLALHVTRLKALIKQHSIEIDPVIVPQEVSNVCADNTSHTPEPRVKIYIESYSAAGMHVPQSFDVVLAVDSTAEQRGVPSYDTLQNNLLKELNIEEAPQPLLCARINFLRIIACARRKFIIQRQMAGLASETYYPSVVLLDLLRCYGLQDDDKETLQQVLPTQSANVNSDTVLPVRTMDESNILQCLANENGDRTCFDEDDGCYERVGRVGELRENVDKLVCIGSEHHQAGQSDKLIYSASQIESYLSCPYQWFYDRRLNLASIDKGFSAVELGTFAHSVLEQVHRTIYINALKKEGIISQDATSDAVASVLATPQYCQSGLIDDTNRDDVHQLFELTWEELNKRQFLATSKKDKRYVQTLVPHTYDDEHIKDLLHENISAFLSYEACHLNGFVPTLFEWSFGKDKVVEYAGIPICGSIDRVDIDSQGNLIVLDYKYKKSDKFADTYAFFNKNILKEYPDGVPLDKIELPQHIQALIYAQIIRRAFPQLKVVGALYVSLQKPCILAGCVQDGFKDCVWQGEEDESCIERSCIPETFSNDSTNLTGMEALLDQVEDIIREKVKGLINGRIEPQDDLQVQASKRCHACINAEKQGREFAPLESSVEYSADSNGTTKEVDTGNKPARTCSSASPDQKITSVQDLLEQLNPNQQQIVKRLEGPLFVEAGAGSGKTFTLACRVLWALTKGSKDTNSAYLGDLSQVLVITYTNAAAREIRNRIRVSLHQVGMHEHALQVEDAWISTIHGMCSRILTKYAFEIGLDPCFRIASANEKKGLMTSAYNEEWDLAKEDSSVKSGLEDAQEIFDSGSTHTGDNGERVNNFRSTIEEIINLANTLPHGFDDLKAVNSSDGSYTISDLFDMLSKVTDAGKEQLTSIVLEKCKAAKKTCEEVLNQTKGSLCDNPKAGASALYEILQAFKGLRTTGKNGKNSEAIKIKHWIEGRLVDCIALCMHDITSSCFEFAQRVNKRYEQLKLQSGLLDENDLILKTLEALREHHSIAQQLSSQFRLVMVDEFQDTDSIQLELIKLLSDEGKHLTTVGDAQQSIYGFRGADVSIFRKRASEVADDQKITLNINYRSNEDVLAFVEAVCNDKKSSSDLPVPTAQGIIQDFMPLIAASSNKATAQTSSEGACNSESAINVELTKASAKGDRQAIAQDIAQRMKEYVDAGHPMSDITLLLGKMTHLEEYISAIRRIGLTCVVCGGSGFHKTAEVEIIANLLQVLANPQDEKDALYPLLMSSVFRLDDNDMLLLTSKNATNQNHAFVKQPLFMGVALGAFPTQYAPSQRLLQACKILNQACADLAYKTPSELCTQVIRQSGWFERNRDDGLEGEAHIANMCAALHFVSELCDEAGLGIATAAQEFDRWRKFVHQSPFTLAKKDQNFIRVMTIHASKGLQFNMVVLAEWAKSNSTSKLHVIQQPYPDNTYGLVILPSEFRIDEKRKIVLKKLYDDIALYLNDSKPQSLGECIVAARSERQDKNEAEAARLVYVGLTRAKESLVFSLQQKDPKKKTDSSLDSKIYAALFGESVSDSDSDSDFQEGKTYCRTIKATGVSSNGNEESEYPICVHVVNAGESANADDLKENPVSAQSSMSAASICEGTLEDAQQAHFYVPHDAPIGKLGIDFTHISDDFYSYSLMQADDLLRGRSSQNARGTSCARLPKVQKDKIRCATALSTNFGSAFHQLAEMIHACCSLPTQAMYDAICARWDIDQTMYDRLRTAIELWYNSSIRKKCLGFKNIVSEFPFVMERHDIYGDYIEGAFDLLAYNDSDALLIDFKTGDKRLSYDAIYARHKRQAELYCEVLRRHGFTSIECAFVCVERCSDEENADKMSAQKEPLVVHYTFEG